MRVLLTLIACAIAPLAVAQEPLSDAGTWLQRMLDAAHGVSYHGEIVHSQAGHRVQSMQIVRRADGDEYLERLLTLDGPPAEVFRDGKSVSCTLPQGRDSLEGRRIPRNPFPQTQWQYSSALHEHYDFLDLGEGRVAGRACQIIGVQPRSNNRYGYRLWVDQETGMLLKTDVVDSAGITLEQVAFTRIELPVEVPEDLLAPTLEGETVRWRVMARDATPGGTAWASAGMPAGFQFKGERVRDAGVIQQVFSDGLATVSIFVAPPQGGAGGLEGISHMGVISAFGLTVDGRQVTVVGEVPQRTVEAIGATLKLQP